MKEKQITKIVFETLDGQQFDTEKEAKEHEKELFEDTFSLKDVATILKEDCKSRATCMGCCFYKGDSQCALVATPQNWIF